MKSFKVTYTARDAIADYPDGESFLSKAVVMRSWAAKQDLLTLREAPQRDVWLMHPAIVNAWYSPNHNTISKYSAVQYSTVRYGAAQYSTLF